MDLKLEYGQELTWVGKRQDISARGDEKIRLAFPLPEEMIPVPTVEEQEAAVEAMNVDATTQAVLGLNVAQLEAKFKRVGLSDEYSKREANRLAKEIVLFDIGLLTHIDPYGGTRPSSSSAARIRRDVTEQTGTGNRRAHANDIISLRNDAMDNALSDRIVKSLMHQWKPIGYPDRRGLPGVQWNTGINEIEVTSPAHRTMEQAELWYKACYRGFTEVLGLPIETAADNGGGGHLHVTTRAGDPIEKDVMFNMCWDLCARPYISWAFADPNDMTEAPAPVQQLSTFMQNGHFGFQKACGMRWANPKHSSNEVERGEFKTTEFRIFRMPRTWEEHKAQIMFVEAWYKVASHRDYLANIEPIRPFKKGRAVNWTEERSTHYMKQFLTMTLGLDWEMYAPFVTDNLLNKFAHYSDELA